MAERTKQARAVSIFDHARMQIASAGSVGGWLLSTTGPLQRALSGSRKRLQVIRNPKAKIVFIEPVYAGPGFAIDAPNGGTFIAQAGTEFRRGFRAELNSAISTVLIGDHTVFTGDVMLQCGAAITIGSHCQIDYGALIADGSFRFRRIDQGLAPEPVSDETARPLTLGDRVTITTKCTVIADVGSQTTVGANSVVMELLPERVLAAGAPAKVVGYFAADSR